MKNSVDTKKATEKKKKEKITYVDDGRSIADMSGLYGGRKMSKTPTSSPVSDILKTYWTATKMMFLPTLAAVGLIVAAYIIVTFIFWLA